MLKYIPSINLFKVLPYRNIELTHSLTIQEYWHHPVRCVYMMTWFVLKSVRVVSYSHWFYTQDELAWLGGNWFVLAVHSPSVLLYQVCKNFIDDFVLTKELGPVYFCVGCVCVWEGGCVHMYFWYHGDSCFKGWVWYFSSAYYLFRAVCGTWVLKKS